MRIYLSNEDNKRALELVSWIRKARDKKKEIDSYESEWTQELIALISKHDELGDYEGMESFETDDCRISFDWRMNRTVNFERALDLIEEEGLDPNSVFNVFFGYSKAKMRNLPKELQERIESITTMKRGKTSLKIEPKTGKEE